MATSDSTPPKGDNVISLSVRDVADIISRVKGAAGDPISVATQLFSALGENVTISGDTFRQALAACAVPVVGSLSDVGGRIGEVAKLGNLASH